MSLKELITRGPRNIRKKLFRDIIGIVLVTATAILAITFYQGRTIKHEISAQLIKESSQLIQERFLNYLLPFDNSLHLLARLVESTLGDASKPQHFEQKT